MVSSAIASRADRSSAATAGRPRGEAVEHPGAPGLRLATLNEPKKRHKIDLRGIDSVGIERII